MKKKSVVIGLIHHGYDLKQESPYEVSWHEQLSGGRAAGKVPEDYNSNQIAKGKVEEMEHTDDPNIAIEIAMDHLEEDPTYYDHHGVSGWNMPDKTSKGLMKWGKKTTVEDMAKSLEGKVKDPTALAVSIRKKALGKKEFSLHQKWGKETDEKKRRLLKAKMKVK